VAARTARLAAHSLGMKRCISAQNRHMLTGSMLVRSERMFATSDGRSSSCVSVGARRAAASCARSASRRRGSNSASRSSCARPTTNQSSHCPRGKQTGSILDWQQSAAVGLSTCAAYSGNQNQSFGLSERRRSPHLVGADPRQRCDDRKRPVDATCTRSQPRRKCRVLQRDLRALHGGAGEPSEARTRTMDAVATTGHIPTVANVSRVLDHQIRRKRLSARQNDWYWPREHAAQVERPTGAARSPPTNHTHHPATSAGPRAAVARRRPART
jgi:hypothetical protein